MNSGQYVFSQLSSFIRKYEFNKIVDKYKGNYRVKSFSCWQQFLCMFYGQLTHRESLRDVVSTLHAHRSKWYHLGLKSHVALSTLADANAKRDWRIWAELARVLIAEARQLYVDDPDFKLNLDHTVYAIDTTTIDLCLSVFPWAKFRKTKAAVRLHTVMDLRGAIPVFVWITDGKTHETNTLDRLGVEAQAFYIMDRGFLDFKRLYAIDQRGAYFVVRARKILKYRRMYSQPVDKSKGLRCDQIGKLTGFYPLKSYPDKIRRIKCYDKERNRYIVLLTNNFDLDAFLICELYRCRWHIELFFKWIKQNLKIKVYWGQSANAVKTQIWIAIASYVLVAILKKRLKIKLSLYEILQILSVSIFDKTPVNELLKKQNLQKLNSSHYKQLNIFDL